MQRKLQNNHQPGVCVLATVPPKHKVQEGKHKQHCILPQPTSGSGTNYHSKLLWTRDL